MTYTSLSLYLILIGFTIVYYLLPGLQWVLLLMASVGFYLTLAGDGTIILCVAVSIAASFLAGVLMDRAEKDAGSARKKRVLLIAGILIAAAPLFVYWFVRVFGFFIPKLTTLPILVPVGLSFYTMQMISYLADVANGRIEAQTNPAKYALFILFFPQIIQGPIPRYSQLGSQLFETHRFTSENLMRGLQMILWGFFLKLCIADKAGIVVDALFQKPDAYRGMYVLTGGVLYSLQLYTDFCACTTLSRGIARILGIHLVSNFRHPYFAVSISDFWRRWHISFSSWLKDYVYIPLGGNRKGKIRKYMNLILTFLVSGLWHGAALNFIVWGLLHVFYQIIGELTRTGRAKCLRAIGVEEETYLWHILKSLGTFLLVLPGWILFRASGLKTGLKMILSIFTVHNVWIFFDDSLLGLGLDWKEWCVLLVAVLILFAVSLLQTKVGIGHWVMEQHLIVRWTLYLGVIFFIVIYGTYGFGYHPQDFIYGGF